MMELRTFHAGAGRIGRLQRNQAARELWAEVYNELSEGKPGLLGSVTSRAEAQVLRLSGLYALLEGSSCIEVNHLRAALALWDYCDRSARWIFGTWTGSPDADRILSALRKAGAYGMRATEISEQVFQRHRKGEAIEEALRLLSVSNLAAFSEEPTGGATARRWFAAGCKPAN